jgi:hypothetical protein
MTPVSLDFLKILAGCKECTRKGDCLRLEVNPAIARTVKEGLGCKDRRIAK